MLTIYERVTNTDNTFRAMPIFNNKQTLFVINLDRSSDNISNRVVYQLNQQPWNTESLSQLNNRGIIIYSSRGAVAYPGTGSEAHPLGTPLYRVPSSDKACYIRHKTWLSTLATAYFMRGVVAQWLERRIPNLGKFITHIPCVFRMRHYKPLVPSIGDKRVTCRGLHILA